MKNNVQLSVNGVLGAAPLGEGVAKERVSGLERGGGFPQQKLNCNHYRRKDIFVLHYSTVGEFL